jgi:mannose-6-phosphate isomerase-like protein (cupin superfamily)
MVAIGTEIESPQTGERLIFRSTADSSAGELFQAELIMRPGSYVVRSHVHPSQEESFVVLEGRFGWKIGKESGVAEAGETLVCPPRLPHSQWNAGDGPMRILYEHRPALTSAEIFFETYFGLSRDGKLSSKGDMSPFQASVLLPVVGDFIRPTQPPLFLQAPLFAALAPIARRRGYRARYPQYALPME